MQSRHACSQNLIQRMKRAAQEMTSTSRSRLADWPDAKGTDEKVAFPREGQTTGRALTERSQTTTYG